MEGKGYDLQTISSQTHVTQAMECDFTNGLETKREDSDGEKKVSYGFFFLKFLYFSPKSSNILKKFQNLFNSQNYP